MSAEGCFARLPSRIVSTLALLCAACSSPVDATPSSTYSTPDGHKPAQGVDAWANWKCETVGTNYCYANYQQRYWIKCYPTTAYPCYFGTNAVGVGDSSPSNSGEGCMSCEAAFEQAVRPWIANH